jgi:rhodanese-related sulfurtransferase
MMNKSGYDSFDEVLERGAIPLNPEQFEHLAEQEEALVLDVRTQQDFAKAHVPNSIFIGLNGSFAPWVGALIADIKQPILLVTPEGQEEEAVTRLSRVGYDNTLGYLEGGVEAWEKSGREIDSIKSISAEKFAEKVKMNKTDQILDVRKPTEFLAHHLLNATNFPLDYINGNMNKLNRNDTYFIHCAGGYRSMIAASILRARGFQNLVDVAGGWKAIEETDAPKTDYACPSTLTQEVVDAAVAAVI